MVIGIGSSRLEIINRRNILRIVYVIFFFSLGVGIGNAQDKKPKNIYISGVVTDVNKVPLKGVMIFIDSLNISERTNKKGYYKFKLKSVPNKITVYAPRYGVVVSDYSGERNLDFIFPGDSKSMPLDSLASKGYVLKNYKNYKNYKNDTSWYAEYSSILKILDNRFHSVFVRNGEVIIGKGINSFNGDTDPLILVDGVRRDLSALSIIPTAEVKLIKVISRGSETATYGSFKANNGVILISMKK